MRNSKLALWFSRIRREMKW